MVRYAVHPYHSSMSLTDREQLARWRQLGARHSEEVVELAPKVLKAGAAGEDEWAVREQLAFAALDMGMVEWASVSLAYFQGR
jgi:hypothetical protein